MACKTIAARVVGLVILCSGVVHAGTIYPAAFSGQPLIYQRVGKIHGCGVRVVGLRTWAAWPLASCAQ